MVIDSGNQRSVQSSIGEPSVEKPSLGIGETKVGGAISAGKTRNMIMF